MSVDGAELVALIGRNGAGKSSLMRTIARLQPAISGEITIDGKPLEKFSRRELASLLSFVSTEPVSIAYLAVKQLVALGRFPYTNWIGKLGADDITLVEEAIQSVDLTLLAEKNLHEISDGERQRAMLARSLAQDSPVILLDEPTAFLDMPAKYEIINLLHRLTRTKRKTIIFSTHDLNIAMQEADKLWLIIDGVLYEGAPEDMALNRQFAQMFEGTNLVFDDCNGQFNIKRKEIKSVRVAGEGKTFFWTKRALERLQFEVRKAENEKHADIVVKDSSWTLKDADKRINFNSIYELAKYFAKN